MTDMARTDADPALADAEATTAATLDTNLVQRRALLTGGVMLATAGAAYAVTPRRIEHRLARRKLGDLVPRKVGPWSAGTAAGIVVPTEEIENKDGYDQQLTRVYNSPGRPTIMLLVAYGSTQGGTLQLHRPETCYPGQGFHISTPEDESFPLADGTDVLARRFTAVRGDRTERLVYWTRIARSFPRSTLAEYRAIISSVLRGVVPDGVLTRISTIGPDIPVSDTAIDQFAKALAASIPPMGADLLFGHP